MKARLLHRDRDFDVQAPLPWNERALIQDLELSTLLRATARDDELVHEVALNALLTGCDAQTILYRQAIVRDALRNPAALRQLYEITVDVFKCKRKHYFFGLRSRYPASMLIGAVEMLEMLVGFLRRLRDVALAHTKSFASEGFGALFALLKRELTDEYFADIDAHLAHLRFRRGVLISAELGPGHEGAGYVLRQGRKDERNWLQRVLARRPPSYTYRLPDRDEAGAQALGEMRDRGIHLVASALAQAADHIDSFFQMLRVELSFYVGCRNLYEQLTALGEPVCFPSPLPVGERRMRCNGLYDPCLALQMQRGVVGNRVDADSKGLVIITGANQGGKSSFLRAVGVAQLMMQCGMFVGAEAFEGELCTKLLTHYKREEDAALKSGKFDEELTRVSEIVDHLEPHALLLFNESFASTTEREGSEIARQVVSVLLEKDIKVFFVTHLHAFAHGLFERAPADALFLRAERGPDGIRSFRLVEGEPLATSYGKDLYERIFVTRA